MRLALPILLAFLAATPAPAQEEPGFFSRLFGTDEAQSDDEQGGMLETFIEDNLSGEGRSVSITGFAGALSGRATLDSLTISDDRGEWLTLTDVVLDWSRGALFRGRLEVAELSAAEIRFPRLPAPAEAQVSPTPEASGFSLPELPVSVVIDKISAARVEIGEPVLGVAALVAVDGGLRLENGEGSAELKLDKLDAPGGISLAAGYSNVTGVLALDLAMTEGPDGIAATLLGLPGHPAVDFSLKGEAPITAFAGDIRLATDGAERLSGRITTSQAEDAEAGTLQTVLDVSGDIAPVFLPEYQPFFGPDVRLAATATSFPDGRFTLNGMEISAAAIQLAGAVEIGPDRLPDRIAFNGSIAAPGGPVLLPLSGAETRVDRIDLNVAFDASKGDDWTGAFTIAGLERPGFSAERLVLEGEGRISTGSPQSVTAAMTFSAEALDLGDPQATEALGETVSGQARIDWTSGEPLKLRQMRLDGESYSFDGDADFAMSDSGPAINGKARIAADQLAVFSGIARRKLGGSVEVETMFDTQPLVGSFDVTATGTGRDLIVGQPQADRILAGTARLEISAKRDETGIDATLRKLESAAATLTGRASLKSGGSSVSLAGNLRDAGDILPELSGPLALILEADEDANRVWTWNTDTSLGGTRLAAKGTATDVFSNPSFTASGRLEADDLSQFAALVKRPLSGALTVEGSGGANAALSRFEFDGTAASRDLVVGHLQADRLLRGDARIDLKASRDSNGHAATLRALESDAIRMTGEATLSDGASSLTLNGNLRDVADILPELSGSLDLNLKASEDEAHVWTWITDTTLDGTRLAATGTAADIFGVPEIAASGRFESQDLGQFAALAKRPLTGQVTLEGQGSLRADLTRFDVRATVEGEGLGIGEPEADRLLAGKLSARIDANRDGDAINIRDFALSTGLLEALARGSLSSSESSVQIDARLADVASFVPGFSGPLTTKGTVGQSPDGRYSLDLQARGPAGTEAHTTGSIAPDFATVDLAVKGNAELAFINRFIAPRAASGTVGFDLRVNGPPSLASVSGNVSASNARLIAPALRIVLNQMSLNASLSGGRAQLNMAAQVENGGTLAIEGPVTLADPFDANLNVALNGVVLRDPRLYETSVDGRVSIAGPLAGGASISGKLDLGETNIRIPSSGLGGSGAVPEITHLNEPHPVRGTRQRAGLLDPKNGNGAHGGPSYPLDITVNAPNRLFIRGRGLDSEFGGSLRVTGTTTDTVPSGAFNLIRGRLDILGQRLALEEATVTIQGTFLPVVRIRASTVTGEYTVNVNVVGPVTDPEITFTSEPELPQEEVLARLIFGRGLDTLSPLQAARLTLAVRTLAGRGGEGVVGNIRQGAGLADLDVTTDEEGNAAVRAGAYLGDRIYTDVTVGSTGESSLSLNLDVTPSVTLKGSVTNAGDTSVGVFFERDY